MPKRNPLNLNPLQLKTLTLMQHLARQFGEAPAGGGEGIEITQFPHAHGDHFHVGNATVMTRDASGLGNEAVWVALARKGLIENMFPYSAVVLPLGLDYDTGMAEQILHRADH